MGLNSELTMDLNTLRAIITVVTFVCFIAIVLWAYSRRREKQFDEAALLPFADEFADGFATQRGAESADRTVPAPPRAAGDRNEHPAGTPHND